LSRRVVVPNTPVELAIEGGQQILLEKQTFDCFTNVNLAGLLERLGAGRYVVYGVVTEICVKLAAWGLLKTGKRVELVTDAVRSLNDAAAAAMTDAFLKAGGVLTTVSVATRKP
jgi:nicotinamidase/pyrazinamidase